MKIDRTKIPPLNEIYVCKQDKIAQKTPENNLEKFANYVSLPRITLTYKSSYVLLEWFPIYKTVYNDNNPNGYSVTLYSFAHKHNIDTNLCTSLHYENKTEEEVLRIAINNFYLFFDPIERWNNNNNKS